ncbi:hypothetical protein SNE40_013253 [Patella caerulea]|uniref:PRELI/MSF1 domain-containing protein n=1 Tax=Patella caerulea TaxID=87958 RepID=A0AAN8JKL5_PATCE
MVKYYTSTALFKYTWDQVAIALWQRYPNPYSKHVLSEDVVHREVINGKLYTKRLLTKTNPMPRWGEHFVRGPRHICVVEESIVDPKNKSLTTYTRNIGMQKLLTIIEKCDYIQNPENLRTTQCNRWAWFQSSFYGFRRALQAFGVERYKSNVTKNVKGFNTTLEQLFMTDIPQQTKTKQKLTEKAKHAVDLAKSKTQPLLTSSSQLP